MPAGTALYQSIGGTAFPLDAASFTSSLAPIDPARSTLLALFKSAINAELATVWASATATTSLAGTSPVQLAIELEPNPSAMLQTVMDFPLLALHRSGEPRFEHATLSEDRLVQEWDLHYILGALDIAEVRRLGDACLAVIKILRLVIRQRGHGSYQSGAVQFFGNTGSLASVELKSVLGPGKARFAEGDTSPEYYAVTMRLETVELTADDLDAYAKIEALDVAAGGGDDQGVISELVLGTSDAPFQYG